MNARNPDEVRDTLIPLRHQHGTIQGIDPQHAHASLASAGLVVRCYPSAPNEVTLQFRMPAAYTGKGARVHKRIHLASVGMAPDEVRALARALMHAADYFDGGGLQA